MCRGRRPVWSQRSGCLCRTIRFWDLEKFQVVSCIEGEPGPVRYAGCWAWAVLPGGEGWVRGAFPPVLGSPRPPQPPGTHGHSRLPRSILFNPDGCCLYSGCQDSLRVYGWEPERCFDMVLVNWGKVADLAICNNQLVRPLPAHPPRTVCPAAPTSPAGPPPSPGLAGLLPTSPSCCSAASCRSAWPSPRATSPHTWWT